MVRVYALKTPGPFQSADFFSLYDKDSATLGAELVKREELQLAPGEKKTLQFTLPPDVKSVGVMAAYRDLERARWRDLQPLEVGQPNTFKLNLGARQVSLVK
jgi:type VI secretion system protein VasD